MSSIDEDLKLVPRIKFVDHVAIAVKQGELDRQVEAYAMLGFHEVHREEVLGGDQVREALLRIGDGPNLIQLLEPLTADSPVQKLIDRNGGRGGLGSSRFPRGERATSL
jgi:methylmalonyl-CoA/ethylmalonyl-CoA epimerase